MSVHFEVIGTPVTQGNKTGFVQAGRVVMVEGRRGPARKAFATWRAAVTAAAADEAPISGPVTVVLGFRLRRPPSHLTKTGNLRKGKPTHPIAPRHDIDKLARAVLDSLTAGGVIEDDGRVVCLSATKQYVHPSDVTGVQITITGLCDEHAAEEPTT